MYHLLTHLPLLTYVIYPLNIFSFEKSGNFLCKVQIKQLPMSEATDVVILEEPFEQPPDIPDVGCEIQLATLFGKCSYMIRKDQVRDLKIANVNQLSHQDSVSIVIKSAIQRGWYKIFQCQISHICILMIFKKCKCSVLYYD